MPLLFYENRFITDFKEKPNFSIFSSLKNAPLFLVIALFQLMLTILLRNTYLNSYIFRQKYWKNGHGHGNGQGLWT